MSTAREWNAAIAACVRQFDTDEQLRAIWAKEDAEYLAEHASLERRQHWTYPASDQVEDPVRGLRPPKIVLDHIRNALKRLEAASENARQLMNAELEKAACEDSPTEQQTARNEIVERYSRGTAEEVAAENAVKDAMAKAGVYALSLRHPSVQRLDCERTTRNADPAESKLFAEARQAVRDYPSNTRRRLHAAASAGERARIKAKARADCRVIAHDSAENARKASAEMRAQREAKHRLRQKIDQMGGVCATCQWAHQPDMTFWLNPQTGATHQIHGASNKQTFLKELHAKMEKANGADVSLSDILCNGKSKAPKDILGTHFEILFFATGVDRGRIRRPNEKRPPGRPPTR